MSITVKVVSRDGYREEETVDKLPNICPSCHQTIEAGEVEFFFLRTVSLDPTSERIETVFCCPKPTCGKTVIGVYCRNCGDNSFRYHHSVPLQLVKEPDIYKIIQRFSPNFCTIRDQAEAAEKLGLNLAAGCAYRAGLEFLIKGYVCSLYPQARSGINRMSLRECIWVYCPNGKIKEACSLTSGFEKYCDRKWTDSDLQKLKELINIAIGWIESETIVREASETISKWEKTFV